MQKTNFTDVGLSQSEPKTCERCGGDFFRIGRMTQAQWDGRRFCSKRCSALRRDTEKDVDIVAMYEDGMSCDRICKIVGMSNVHIARILKENGIATEPYRSQVGGLSLTKDGYLRFNDSLNNGIHKGRRLHDIVAEMKIGRMLAKNEVVHHDDGIQLNNHPDNLIVLTRSEHTKLHVKRDGREKLSDSDVRDIRRMYDNKRGSQTRISERYNVSISLINHIVNNKIRRENV